MGTAIVKHRVEMVALLDRMAKQLENERAAAAAAAGWTFRKLGAKLHIPLMKWAGARVGIEDPSFPDRLAAGLPIVGPASTAAFFQPFR
eukprot:5975513-Alexandrium_andersonii.AAC.1